jgi:hypothetical protein
LHYYLPLEQCMKSIIPPHNWWWHLESSAFFHFNNSNEGKVVSHCGFSTHLVLNIFFMCLWVNSMLLQHDMVGIKQSNSSFILQKRMKRVKNFYSVLANLLTAQRTSFCIASLKVQMRGWQSGSSGKSTCLITMKP